ncbi:MAG: alpha/beta fold hydrolase BchO [bacterium]
MTTTPEWDSLRSAWPNAAASRFVDVADVRWHVQLLGAGPAVLLLHGSGAASHSWRDIAPRLARTNTVVVPDLPGHGFTSVASSHRLSLDGIATQLDALLTTLDVSPPVVAGHSSGGALALRLAMIRPMGAVVGVNAALTPPPALSTFFAPLIRDLARSRVMGTLTALLAESDLAFRALMRSTGSTVSKAQYELYRTFARSPAHTSALMTMFAGWDLTTLRAALPSLATPVTLVVGTRDGWVPPVESRLVAQILPDARVIEIEGAGHLAHEEFPERVSDIIAEAAQRASVTGDPAQRTP